LQHGLGRSSLGNFTGALMAACCLLAGVIPFVSGLPPQPPPTGWARSVVFDLIYALGYWGLAATLWSRTTEGLLARGLGLVSLTLLTFLAAFLTSLDHGASASTFTCVLAGVLGCGAVGVAVFGVYDTPD
jgi:hypothetical protein